MSVSSTSEKIIKISSFWVSVLYTIFISSALITLCWPPTPTPTPTHTTTTTTTTNLCKLYLTKYSGHYPMAMSAEHLFSISGGSRNLRTGGARPVRRRWIRLSPLNPPIFTEKISKSKNDHDKENTFFHFKTEHLIWVYL